MASRDTVDVLNRLMAIHCRSFPQYLAYARPYIPPGRQDVLETLEQIVTDQERMSERISTMLKEADAVVDTGEFPMQYTDLHDLSIDFLLPRAAEKQKQDIAAIGACVEELRMAPAAQALAEEASGMAKGHLELLEEAATAKSGS